MSQAQPVSNVILVEVPPQFIALCQASGVSPQATLRGMAAMLCGLRCDEDNRLLPLEGECSRPLPRRRLVSSIREIARFIAIELPVTINSFVKNDVVFRQAVS